MLKYRTKPVIVEAIQYTPANLEEVLNVMGIPAEEQKIVVQEENNNLLNDAKILGSLNITDPNGNEMTLDFLDWLVIEEEGLLLITDAEFQKRFEKLD